MAIPKLKVTRRGARELSGPGEVIITKVGFGHNYETDMERASISGVTSIASFQPTVTQEGDYQIIDVTFDNENTGKAQYSNTFLKTIAIYRGYTFNRIALAHHISFSNSYSR